MQIACKLDMSDSEQSLYLSASPSVGRVLEDGDDDDQSTTVVVLFEQIQNECRRMSHTFDKYKNTDRNQGGFIRGVVEWFSVTYLG